MKLLSFLYGNEDPFGIFDSVETITDPLDVFGVTEPAILLLHGGADISLKFYNGKPNKYGHGPAEFSVRDRAEKEVIENALAIEMPIIGICRGAQMLCAMDGGQIVQHIVGHAGGRHVIKDKYSGEQLMSNSAHHQMMQPRDGNDIIASCPREVMGYEDDEKEYLYTEVPEVVHFIQMNAIGIQGHPEWAIGSPFAEYCGKIIKDRIWK